MEDAHGSAPRFTDQQASNPITRRSFVHLFTFAVAIGRPRAALEQKADDADLLLARPLRTGAAAPCGLNGKMQRRRPSLVRLPWIGAGVYQRSYRGHRPCSDGSVQRRDTGAVQRIGTCSNSCEVLNYFSLRSRVPVISVRRVMQRFRSSSISRPAVGAVRNQELGNRAAECRRSHVESRIAAIEIVTDIGKEEVGGCLSRRADLGRSRGESGSACHTAGHLVKRPADDEPNKIKESCVRGPHQFTNSPIESLSNEMFVVSGFHQLLVRLPDVFRDVLVNLKASRRVEPNPLQIADHDTDHVGGGQRVV